jgi:hypothetical protein
MLADVDGDLLSGRRTLDATVILLQGLGLDLDGVSRQLDRDAAAAPEHLGELDGDDLRLVKDVRRSSGSGTCQELTQGDSPRRLS